MRKEALKLIPVAFFLFFTLNGACAAAYDFYVDKNSSQGTEDGSEQYPWKTIGAAMGHIRSESLDNKTIFVKKGTYSEAVEVTNDANIVGEDRHETVISGESRDYGLYFRDTDSAISNLTVEKGQVNVEVEKHAGVTVDGCSVRDSNGNGVKVDESSTAKKYKFTFRNSSVKDSGKRGIYIFKRRIEITGSEISGNDEEGLDLHASVKGKISGNEIKDNGESGVEMIAGGANVTIRGNHLTGNDTQGIGIQFYNSRKGKIRLTKNSIRNNKDYGVRYARYDHGKIKMKFRDFINKCVKKSGNTISGNGDGDYAYQWRQTP